ncbi:MAG: hypothetical protein ACLUEQ_04390 [Cloacibacillus evryensis]
MNSYDGDRLRTALLHQKWEEVPDGEADVVILVTCSIREKAEQKVASEIGRYDAVYKKKSPAVALVGCMLKGSGARWRRSFPVCALCRGRATRACAAGGD